MNKWTLIALLIMCGCASHLGVKPVCRHKALYYAIAYRDLTGKQVRIVRYPINPSLHHAEAQSLEPDGWYWLDYKNGVIRPTEKTELEPPKVYSIQEWQSIGLDL